MPTYEYHCESCGYEFEEFQAISAAPILICPKCGGTTRRIISGGAGLIFKGTGFYVTDYKRKENPERTGESSVKASPTKSESGKSTTDSTKK